jgi:hypothetical protein
MAKVTCYVVTTTRGHELRRLRDGAFIRPATPAETAASDDAAEHDGGRGAFEVTMTEPYQTSDACSECGGESCSTGCDDSTPIAAEPTPLPCNYYSEF